MEDDASEEGYFAFTGPLQFLCCQLILMKHITDCIKSPPIIQPNNLLHRCHFQHQNGKCL